MSVRAFVGHSFTHDDAIMVRAFTDYFAQVASLTDGFSWVHAEPAEPEELTQKVTRLFQDCNTFIGICSKKEFAAMPSKTKRSWMSPGKAVLKSEDLVWKTSDWIIQEIGYAVGRGMKVILLLENGVRSPGGLQGNVEHIPFDREAPQNAFGKFLEMVQALLPADKGVLVSIPAQQPPTTSDAAPSTEADGQQEPTEHWLDGPVGDNWDFEKYSIAMRVAIFLHQEDRIQAIQAAFETSKFFDGHAASFEASAEAAKLGSGLGGSLEDLRIIGEKNPDNEEVSSYWAQSLAHFGEYAEAAKVCLTASDRHTVGSPENLRLLGAAARYQASAGEAEQARATIRKLRELTHADDLDAQRELARTIRTVAESQDETAIFLAALERLASLSPDNADARFQLGYQHSQNGNRDLALVNYLRIPKPDREALTWNNLGVSLGDFSMTARATDAFRKAHEMGETLATSNLANQYLKGGFAKEAKELCLQVVQKDDVHANVMDSLASADKAYENEGETEKDQVQKTAGKTAFYRELGTAIAAKDIAIKQSTWIGPSYKLTLATKESAIVGRASYTEAAVGGLGIGFALPGAEAGKQHTTTVTIRGEIRGKAGFGRLIRKSDRPATFLSSANSENEVVMYFNEAEDTLSVMPREGGPIDVYHREIAAEIEAKRSDVT